MVNIIKYTKSEIEKICNTLERKKTYAGELNDEDNFFETIDNSRTKLNYNLEENKNQIEFIKKRCSEIQCLNRHDIKVLCIWVIKKPDNISEDLEKNFFQETYNFLSKRYGEKNNIVSSYVHKDEDIPHMHFAFIPIVFDLKRGNQKVSAKECITKTDLKTFYKDFEKYIYRKMNINIKIYNENVINKNKTEKNLDKETTNLINKMLSDTKNEKIKFIEDTNKTMLNCLQIIYKMNQDINDLIEYKNTLESNTSPTRGQLNKFEDIIQQLINNKKLLESDLNYLTKTYYIIFENEVSINDIRNGITKQYKIKNEIQFLCMYIEKLEKIKQIELEKI